MEQSLNTSCPEATLSLLTASRTTAGILIKLRDNVVTTAVTKLHASRPRKDFAPLYRSAISHRYNVQRRQLCYAANSEPGSAVGGATLYDSVVALKRAIWWSLPQKRYANRFVCSTIIYCSKSICLSNAWLGITWEQSTEIHRKSKI
jgi:hypothetical protein